MTEIFGGFADEYERHRPSYPEAMWTALLEGNGVREVVDLGCGTGRAARQMARRGLSVVGVEPEAGMREEAVRAAAREGLDLDVREGSAEATGLDDASADLVVAAQAFHWFDPGSTRREVHRILRPQGTFAIWWNDRQVDGVPWMQAYEGLIEKFNPRYRPGYRAHSSDEQLLGDGLFGELRFDEFDHFRSVDADGFVALAFTSSYLRNTISDQRRTEFEGELRAILRREHGEGSFEIPYRTRLYRVRAQFS